MSGAFFASFANKTTKSALPIFTSQLSKPPAPDLSTKKYNYPQMAADPPAPKATAGQVIADIRTNASNRNLFAAPMAETKGFTPGAPGKALKFIERVN